MHRFEILEHLKKAIQSNGYDIKPEPQLLQAIDGGILYDDFWVSNDNQFRREHSRDISEVESVDVRNQELLHLHLSRSGIYDQLPEGLFFQMPQRDKRTLTVADMASDYKENKKREAEIRRFFLPFEHDFFLQRMSLDAEEAALLKGVQSGMLTDYFNDFWNLSGIIPAPFVSNFIVLLSHASKITGDLKLLAKSLQFILQEQVSIRYATPVAATAPAESLLSRMGEMQLGMDMVCGNSFWEGEPEMLIQIGPLVNSKLAVYLPGAERDQLINSFADFFVPAGIDIRVELLLLPEARQLQLAGVEDPVLGYSCFLS